jgi:hypothetical protein
LALTLSSGENSNGGFGEITSGGYSDAADLLVRWDLTEKIWQHRLITDVVPGDLDSANLQCFLIDPEMDLAPDSPLGAAMLAGVPFAFVLDLDASAVDQQVQPPL